MEITPAQLNEWLAILGKPTLGVVAFIVIILYREAIIHIIKVVADVIGSWTKRR